MTRVEQHAAVDAGRIWDLWADVPGWAAWNPDVSSAALDGPFAEGSTVRMTLGGGDVVVLTLVDVQPRRSFTDEASLDGVVLRTRHEVQPSVDPAGCRVVYEMTASGTAPQEVLDDVVAGVSADFPETVAALLAAAAGAPSRT